jgi:uncharacterized protein (TIGR03435 family)
VRIYFLLLFLALAACVDSGKSQEIKEGSAGEAKLTASTNVSAVSSEWSISPNRLLARNRTLHDIILIACPNSPPIVDETGLTGDRFDLLIEGNNATADEYWKSLQKTLREKFLIFAVVERRQIEIYELTSGGEKPEGLVKSVAEDKQAQRTNSNGWEFTGFTMDDLVAEFNNHLDLPVYNESRLEGRYDFTIDWDGTLFADKIAESLKKIGLNLDKVKREKEVLVVKSTRLQLPK